MSRTHSAATRRHLVDVVVAVVEQTHGPDRAAGARKAPQFLNHAVRIPPAGRIEQPVTGRCREPQHHVVRQQRHDSLRGAGVNSTLQRRTPVRLDQTGVGPALHQGADDLRIESRDRRAHDRKPVHERSVRIGAALQQPSHRVRVATPDRCRQPVPKSALAHPSPPRSRTQAVEPLVDTHYPRTTAGRHPATRTWNGGAARSHAAREGGRGPRARGAPRPSRGTAPRSPEQGQSRHTRRSWAVGAPGRSCPGTAGRRGARTRHLLRRPRRSSRGTARPYDDGRAHLSRVRLHTGHSMPGGVPESRPAPGRRTPGT